MTKEDDLKKARSHHPERVGLSPESLGRISGWVDTVTAHLKGSAFSRSDMVNWLITNRPAALLDSEVSSITRAFFNPLKAVIMGTRLIKEKQLAGEEIDVKAFLDSMLCPTPPKPKRQPRKPKADLPVDPQS